MDKDAYENIGNLRAAAKAKADSFCETPHQGSREAIEELLYDFTMNILRQVINPFKEAEKIAAMPETKKAAKTIMERVLRQAHESED